MSSEGWWRFYNGAPHNPKLLKLSDKQHRLWTNLMCFASENGGTLSPLDDIAISLRMPLAKLKRALEELIDAKLFDRTETGITPHNWSTRQYKSDVSTPRVKRFRQRSRNGGGNAERNVSETPPEAEAEAEAEGSASAEPSGARELEETLRKAAGWENEPHPGLVVTGQIQALLKAGADLGVDVLPVIRAHAPNVRSRTGWKYFVGPIQDAMNARIDASKPQPQRTRNGHASSRPTLEDSIETAIEFRRHRDAQAGR